MKSLLIPVFALVSLAMTLPSRGLADELPVIRIGIIGLDTSHAPAFAKLFHSANPPEAMKNQRITHAYPGGSSDIESSIKRVPGYTKEIADMGIVIVDSIDELLKNVDAVLLHSLDGRKHLEQVIPVFQAKKPVFIDKPLGGSLAQCIAIQKLGEKHRARWFTSSSLRYSKEMIRYREHPDHQGIAKGAIAWGPCSLEPTHPDLYWYGVHGVEMLFTAMGRGCEQVTRVSTTGTDVAIGTWSDGRVGEFRGLRDGASGYGLVVFGQKSIEIGGKFDGYGPLAERVALFFRGKDPGVDPNESVEMFAFMEAADESKRNGGKPVTIREVMARASVEADVLVNQ
jgi:hypothetical protein